ncbi:MAG: hypothetical protein AB7D57_08900 [Desulfovibrionaceae bacterium]
MLHPLFSVIVPGARDGGRLPRLLAALAGQDFPRPDLEIILTAAHAPDPAFVRRWGGILAPARLRVTPVPPDAGRAARRNAGLDAAAGALRLCLDPEFRLHPAALTGLALALERAPWAGGVHAGDATDRWLRSGPGRPGGLERTGAAQTWRLRRGPATGPCLALRRTPDTAGLRYRDVGRYLNWDLAIQLHLAGVPLTRADRAMPGFRPIMDRSMDRSMDRIEEERSRAQVVAANPGFFDRATLAWALALLRGEAWAKGTKPAEVPGGLAVRLHFERHLRAVSREARLRAAHPEVFPLLVSA